VLIDLGVQFPQQGVVLGLWCLALSVALVFIARRISAELTSTPTVPT
jgi:ABC-type thiamin/hydroxymethylpyrimidine transport system permease subunit